VVEFLQLPLSAASAPLVALSKLRFAWTAVAARRQRQASWWLPNLVEVLWSF
jgi:hypothetical protein